MPTFYTYFKLTPFGEMGNMFYVLAYVFVPLDFKPRYPFHERRSLTRYGNWIVRQQRELWIITCLNFEKSWKRFWKNHAILLPYMALAINLQNSYISSCIVRSAVPLSETTLLAMERRDVSN